MFHEQLKGFAETYNQSLASKSSMRIGQNILHPDGYLVHIVSGQYLDPTYGRVSNFWYWRRVNEDGTLSETTENGYGW